MSNKKRCCFCLKEVYTGKETIRGINVMVWKACVFNKQNSATQRISFYMSGRVIQGKQFQKKLIWRLESFFTFLFPDPDAWQLANPPSELKSIPVGMHIENKLPNNTEWSESYTVTKYRRDAFLANEEIWTVIMMFYFNKT